MIVHFNPLELYPPIQNLLKELERTITDHRVIVISTKTRQAELSEFSVSSRKIVILRPVIADKRQSTARRYSSYLVFYFSCLLNIIRYSPEKILYFETISSFSVYLYKRFIKRNTNIYIHYHEYISGTEYSSGMKLVKWFHHLERWLYPRARWVSHTNESRLDQFTRDIAPVEVHNPFILPNYPPKSWRRPPRPLSGKPLRIVYAGALSLHTMFTRKFAEWVMQQNGCVVWDIYSYNCTDEAREYLEALGSPFVNLKHGVDYHDLPKYFSEYHVGVILYNGHIPNYVYNAPNKLFEYWACGLSVWFPDVMIGSLPYCTTSTYPAIVPLNFNSLENLKPEEVMSIPKSIKESSYFCEDALHEIVHQLIK